MRIAGRANSARLSSAMSGEDALLRSGISFCCAQPALSLSLSSLLAEEPNSASVWPLALLMLMWRLAAASREAPSIPSSSSLVLHAT